MNKFVLTELLRAYKSLVELKKRISDDDVHQTVDVVTVFNIANVIFETIGAREDENYDNLEQYLTSYIESHDQVNADSFLKEIEFYLKRLEKD